MSSKQRFLACGAAISATAIALLLTLWLEPLLSRTIGAFFYIAITISAFYGGLSAGIVATALSTLAIDYFFIPPARQLAIAETTDILRLGIFLIVALIVNALSNNLHQSNQKNKRLSQQLAQENAEQQRLVMEITQRIRQSLNLSEILQTTVDEVRHWLQCDRALIFKIEPDYRGTVLVESVNPGWKKISASQIYDPCVGSYLSKYCPPAMASLGGRIARTDCQPIIYCHSASGTL